MAHQHLSPPPGWGEEARQALVAVQEALTTPAEDDCPVCAGVSALCDHGPQWLDRLAGLATGLARTLREMTPEPGGAGPGAGEDGDRGTAPSHRPVPPTTVRIDVSD